MLGVERNFDLAQLRQIAVLKQCLVKSEPLGAANSAVHHLIEHLGYVQIDTLSVVERAHHHVLWSRLPQYEQDSLNTSLAEKAIFEYWYHAAAYLPMRDYRYALLQMALVRSGQHRYFGRGDKNLMREILARVKSDGPIRQRDMDRSRHGSNGQWWNWGAGRRAMETLFMQGDLMICARHGMEKVYDLAENCLPDGVDLTLPTLHEYASYLLETTRRAHGVFTWKQLMHLRTGAALRTAMREVLDQALAQDVFQTLVLDSGETVYVETAALACLPSSFGAEVKILSPFDNLVIHRERLSALFAFDYRMECYVPAPKRVYGYFCLPILYGDQLVARVDCKAHRSERRLEVLSLHLESHNIDRAHFFAGLDQALQHFADFNQCPMLDVRAVRGLHKK